MLTTALFLLGFLTLFATASSSSSSSSSNDDRSGEIARQVLAGVQISRAEFELSSSSSSSSSSSTSDNIDERQARIAAAIRAAVDEPELAAIELPKPYTNLRVRLATSAQPQSCIYACARGYNSRATLAQLEGAVATVVTSNGTFHASFNGVGVAELVDNQFSFKVTATVRGADSAVATFKLETASSLFTGFNITSLTLSTQPPKQAPVNSGQVYFQAYSTNNTFGEFRNATGSLSALQALKIAPGNATFGCQKFADTPSGANNDFFAVDYIGSSSVKITRPDGGLLVTNLGGVNDTVTFNIGDTFVLKAGSYQPTVRNIGLDQLPCATRGEFLYDDITIVTSRAGAGVLANPFDNPSFYNALKTATINRSPKLATFLSQLRLIAGRTQIRLRDAVIDQTTPFSRLSHWSKFTPCFRAYPDPDYVIDVYVPFVNRAVKGTNIGGEVVRARLGPGLVSGGIVQPLNASFALRPQFKIDELAFDNLQNPGVTVVRPLEVLPSDVYAIIENCPADFSYFQ